MRIVENTAERLVLKGTPGSALWMAFATLLGLALMTATAGFAWITYEETDDVLPLIPLGIGFLMGGAFFAIGVVTLAVGRMRLVLDRFRGEGVYDVYSPIIEVGKPCQFRLVHVHSVTIERTEEARPAADVDDIRFDAQVCRARLRLRKPRRAIVLDETENGQERRVRAVAEGVAGWLGIEITET